MKYLAVVGATLCGTATSLNFRAKDNAVIAMDKKMAFSEENMKAYDPKKFEDLREQLMPKMDSTTKEEAVASIGHLLPKEQLALFGASPDGSTSNTPAPVETPSLEALAPVMEKLKEIWLHSWEDFDEVEIECRASLMDLWDEILITSFDLVNIKQDLGEDTSALATQQEIKENADSEEQALQESLATHEASCAKELATVQGLLKVLYSDEKVVYSVLKKSACAAKDPLTAPGQPDPSKMTTKEERSGYYMGSGAEENAARTASTPAPAASTTKAASFLEIDDEHSMSEQFMRLKAQLSEQSSESQHLKFKLSAKERAYLDGQDGKVLLQCFLPHGDSFMSFEKPEVAQAMVQMTHHGERQELNKNMLAMLQQSNLVKSLRESQDPAGTVLDSATAGAKCSISNSPLCPLFQEAIGALHGEITDNIFFYETYGAAYEKNCTEISEQMKSEIADWARTAAIAEAQIASLQGRIDKLTEQGRVTSHRLTERWMSYLSTFMQCHANMKEMYGRVCGVSALKHEMHQMSKVADEILNCKVSKWSWGKCSVECGPKGGVQKYTREVIQAPSIFYSEGKPSPMGNGLPCPHLQAQAVCNRYPCPIDCEMEEWSGWTRCSSDCGVGEKYRVRGVTKEMKFKGVPCPSREELVLCNQDVCDKDCVLTEWTAWEACDKACGGGTQKRVRGIAEEAKGDGYCPMHSDSRRYERKPCNTQACPMDKPVCLAPIDIVFVVDGSGSLGKKNWEKSVDFIKELTSQIYMNETVAAQVAIVEFSTVAITRMGLTDNRADIDTVLNKMKGKWMGQLTATAAGLARADDVLTKGGRDNAASIVVLLTDGYPNHVSDTAYKGSATQATTDAADELKKSARLMTVVVGNQNEKTIDKMREWSSGGLTDLFHIDDFEKLSGGVDDIIIATCPEIEGVSAEKDKLDGSAETQDAKVTKVSFLSQFKGLLGSKAQYAMPGVHAASTLPRHSVEVPHSLSQDPWSLLKDVAH